MAKAKKIKDSVESLDDVDQLGSIFDHLDIASPGKKPEDKGQEGDKTSEVDVQALLQRIASMEGEIRNVREANIALMAAPVAQVAPTYTQPAPAALAPQTWGDPVSDPDEFNQKLLSTIDRIFDQKSQQWQAQQSQKTAQKTQADQLWEDYASQHPEFKDQPDRVGYVAKIVADNAEKKGYDLQRYLANRPQFFSDVTKEMVRVFGEPKGEDDEPTTDTNRTAGIFGGLESGGKPTQGKEIDKPGDLIKDLKDIQRAMGIF